MGQVTVTIADKIYRIACDDGQEAHLMALAAELDRRIDAYALDRNPGRAADEVIADIRRRL